MMTLALCAGFTACSQDYTEKTIEKGVTQNSTTYMSVSFTIPTPLALELKTKMRQVAINTALGMDEIKFPL